MGEMQVQGLCGGMNGSINMGITGTALSAEAGAWRAGLEFAKFLGLRRVIIEGDSHQVVKILKNELQCPAVLEVIVEDVKRWARQFEECLVQIVRRSANVVADKLASFGVRGSTWMTWEAKPSDWLLSFLRRDNHSF